MSIVRPPVFDLGLSQSDSQVKGSITAKAKGKERQPAVPYPSADIGDDSLWVDRYEPMNEGDLAVHKRKIQDVRQWLLEAADGGPSGKLKKYRRILVLTGPAGTAKTATLRVLSRELGYDILEWRNSMDEQFSRNSDFSGGWSGVEYEGLSEKFSGFLTRASSCRSIFSSTPDAQPLSQAAPSSQLPPSSSSSTTLHTPSPPKRQLILLEDLPNILHPPTQAAFHTALESFTSSPEAGVAPLVIIISDAGVRGENPEDEGQRWKSRTKETMDVRNVLSPNLLHSPYVTQISFNPIASTYMRSALKALLDRHFASSSSGARPTQAVLDVIVESSNGDIRSAIMALQFACTADSSTRKPAKGTKKASKGQGPSARVMLEAVTRREQSLALFHLLGKIMYNKRKGDPASSSASAKDIRKDQEIDSHLKDPPPLPPYFRHHERRASRVDVEELYADTPIDASLLSLYIHQNYTQYCTTLDECDALMDTLSYVDASGGESWHQANPHQFHLVALGTLHALPSPVPRRNQKPFKPAFFDSLRKQHEAEDGVSDVQVWLQQNSAVALPGWSQREVVLSAGTALRTIDRACTPSGRAPSTHRLFSTLEFARDSGAGAELAEEGDVGLDAPEPEREVRARPLKTPADDDEVTGRWLSDDDIEEW
ncbi:Rad17-domain-containing protein [Trametes versicolor FP-101664 SS1]|uniref:Rad17-domain-containing protein n=1 Tax=Trametes versicolor (strain FP-101664) TaxID=717944 RepID=UPI0004623B97|nr:Rad17-domain-containing protein [Trametes versicolor FP-101664 SS1]EIW56046.1 Rad17-domain-containing protein [Trametes versicolor FP-101664 SS1]